MKAAGIRDVIDDSGVERIRAGGVVGQVAHLGDLRNLRGDRRLHTFEHRLTTHRATVASSTHREVGGAFGVVTRS